MNAYTRIEKESNHDWNTPVLLKNNGPHLKVSLILWLLITTLNLCFYYQLWVKWVMYTYWSRIFPVILDKLIYNFQNVCGCLTLNEMLIKLVSLIICSINDNLSNTSSTPPPEVKERGLYMVHLIINSFNLNFKDKIFNLL